jgi:hypothetical protein
MEQQMRLMTKFFGIAVALIALTAGVQAQTVELVAAGSSALFLQLGLAAGTSNAKGVIPSGLGATCVWSQSSGTNYSLKVTDSVASETGNAWIAWTPTVSGSCTTINSNTKIYVDVSTDSEVGDRLYFNGGTLGYVTDSPAGAATSYLIFASGATHTEQATLPSTIWNAVSGLALNAAATDITPADAKFAVNRALATPAGAQVVSGSQYLGLGYTAGQTIGSYYNTSGFHVGDFTLPTSGYTVFPVGAVPVVVFVNPSNTTNGFGTLTFGGSSPASISSTALAKYLDGSYGYTGDILASTKGSGANATVNIREPLSGTYNTIEYSIPNTTTNALGTGLDLNTSQDVGVNQLASEVNATSPVGQTGSVPKWNPLHRATADNSSAYDNRAIGTGQEISETLATEDALGYAFWSTANFKNATATTGKYLLVDGHDPLYTPTASNYSTIANTIPTASNGDLSDVTFSDLQNGNYPIWSLLRLVTASSGIGYNTASLLSNAAQNFVNSSGRPDFVPFNNNSEFTSVAPLQVFHSHFAPPGVTFSSTNIPANGTSAYVTTSGVSAAPDCTAAEAGGDVGGVIGGTGASSTLPTVADDLIEDSDATYCAGNTDGQTGYRR